MYSIVRKFRGKTTVVFTNSLSKVQSRIKTLRASNKQAVFSIEPAQTNQKYKKKHKHREH